MARLTLLLATLAALAGCARDDVPPAGLDGPGLTGEIRLASSSSLAPLAREHARWFARLYPSARVEVAGTTARGALVALQCGAADAALIDRAPTPEETAALRAVGLVPTEALVGAGAVVFVTAGGADSLRADDLARTPVYVPSRNTGVAGALAAFAGDAFRPAGTFPTEAALLDALTREPRWIGAVSHAAADSLPAGLRVLRVSAGDGPAVAPTPRRVFEGDYPVVQRLTLVTVRRADTPRDVAALRAGFARFVVGTRGQEAVVRAGWAPATLPERVVEVVGG